jgi:hypothetical protein
MVNFSKRRFVEKAVADSLRTGTVYGLLDAKSDWPVVQASFIRRVLRGLDQNLVPDPQGLRLRHVRVDGRIDLDCIDTKISLELDECDLPEGLTAANARMPPYHFVD